MITNADIIKLSKVLATKEDIKDLSLRLDRVEVVVNSHTIALDGLTKKVSNIEIEQQVMRQQLNRHELWFKLIADKIGIKLKH